MIPMNDLSSPLPSKPLFQLHKTEIALLVIGIIVTILAALATALFLMGLFPTSPAFCIYVFPIIGFLGLTLFSLGSGLLIKKCRDQQRKTIRDREEEELYALSRKIREINANIITCVVHKDLIKLYQAGLLVNKVKECKGLVETAISALLTYCDRTSNYQDAKKKLEETRHSLLEYYNYLITNITPAQQTLLS